MNNLNDPRFNDIRFNEHRLNDQLGSFNENPSFHVDDTLVVNQDNELKTSILIVDSRNRDKNKYPNPNQYQYELNEPYKRVLNSELLYAFIPKTSYLIDNTNNCMTIIDNNKCCNIMFQKGNYNQDSDKRNNIGDINLDCMINSVLGKNNLLGNIKCFYDYNTKKMYFYNSSSTMELNNFTLDFEGGVIETCNTETVKVRKRIQGEDKFKFVQKKYDIKLEKLYKDNSIGEILGFGPGAYSPKVIECFGNKKDGKLLIRFNNIEDFELFNFIMNSSDLRISGIQMEHNDRTHILNCNPEVEVDYTTCSYSTPPKLLTILNIKSSTATQNTVECKWKVSDLNKDTLCLCIDMPGYDGNWTIDANISESQTNITFQTCFVESPHCPLFEKNPYILLQIDEFARFDSSNKTIQNSYELIPFSDTFNIFDTTANYGNIKVFDPILSSLNKLNISFREFNNNLYDFQGKDHCMAFAITYNNKYN